MTRTLFAWLIVVEMGGDLLRVHIKLIGIFALLLNNRKKISFDVQEGTNVIQCIREAADFGRAEFRSALLDKRGEINAEIVVLLNNSPILPSEIHQTTLSSGDILTLIPMVAGG